MEGTPTKHPNQKDTMRTLHTLTHHLPITLALTLGTILLNHYT